MNKKTCKRIIISTILFFTIFSLIIPYHVISETEGWTYQTLTQQNNELNEAPSIAVNKNNVHIVWNCYHTEFDTKIYYIKSTDNGKTWSNITRLSSDTESAVYPVIATQGSIIHVAWRDYRHENPEIYYARSIDNGETWTENKRITYNSTRPTNTYDVGIIVEGINVYLMWKDYRTGSSEIFFKKSTDNGETWGPDQRLTQDYTPSYSPFLAAEGNNLYVLFEEWGTRSDIVFIKSTDKGETWTEKNYLTKKTASGDSENPVLAVNDNNLYLIWRDSRTIKRQIYFKKSNDYGETWTQTVQLTNDDNHHSNPKIKIYENKITAIWQSPKSIWYTTSQDGGETWDETIQIAKNNSNPSSATLAINENNYHIVYQENYNTYGDICYINNIGSSSKDSNDDKKDTKNNSLPGFTIYIFILATLIIVIILTVKIYAKKR